MAAPSSIRGINLLALATARALFLLLRLRPRVTFATGGYVSVPTVLASWLSRVPIVLFLPDVVPGKAIARLAPLARRIAVASEASLPYLPRNRTVVTGYPVRDVFRSAEEGNAAAARHSARQRFGLSSAATVLCVFGGSQGSRAINEALARHLPDVLSHLYIIHICGEKRLEEATRAAAELSEERRSRYRLFPFLHDEAMADALRASNLALCRSGASTLGELPAAGLPAILVPLPEPSVHQRENAEALASAGAAIVLDEAELGERLGPLVIELIGDSDRLAAMASAARAIDRPDAVQTIADLILSVAAT
jgi:UDP-N-acetylglucosamine--N-acetylmuramyl-(pentapeptide) pyrophosphoryl-undecaprenol N-acetylglucosamine transferase